MTNSISYTFSPDITEADRNRYRAASEFFANQMGLDGCEIRCVFFSNANGNTLANHSSRPAQSVFLSTEKHQQCRFHVIKVWKADFNISRRLSSLAHEFVHARQTFRGELSHHRSTRSSNFLSAWKGNAEFGKIGAHTKTRYWDRPWEREARALQNGMRDAFVAAESNPVAPIGRGAQSIVAVLRTLRTGEFALSNIQGLPASAKYAAFWKSSNNSGFKAAALIGVEVSVATRKGIKVLVIKSSAWGGW